MAPDKRAEIRQTEARPAFQSLEIWLNSQLTDISGKSPLAVAIRYALTRMARMRPYLERGILEIDNNTAERAMRAVALGRKNYLFVGSHAGGNLLQKKAPLIDFRAKKFKPLILKETILQTRIRPRPVCLDGVIMTRFRQHVPYSTP